MSSVRIQMDQRTAVLVYAYINTTTEGADMPDEDRNHLEKFLTRLEGKIEWSKEAVERLMKPEMELLV